MTSHDMKWNGTETVKKLWGYGIYVCMMMCPCHVCMYVCLCVCCTYVRTDVFMWDVGMVDVSRHTLAHSFLTLTHSLTLSLAHSHTHARAIPMFTTLLTDSLTLPHYLTHSFASLSCLSHHHPRHLCDAHRTNTEICIATGARSSARR